MTNNSYYFTLAEGRPLQNFTKFPFETIADLLKAGYKLHHVGSCKGYHTRKRNTLAIYSGQFGKGFQVFTNNLASNRFGILVAYFVK